jgi:O6-methylguanine-DNA--protein-cysteine methyltransferase
MVKRRKRLNTRRVLAYLCVLMLIGALILGSPSLLRLARIYLAYQQNDLEALNRNWQWVHEHAPRLETLPPLQTAQIMLTLNQGRASEADTWLTAHQTKDRERFWLFLLRLQQGETAEAQQIAAWIEAPDVRILAEGLRTCARGDAQSALTQLQLVNERALSKSQRSLQYLSLSALMLHGGDDQQAEQYLRLAEDNQPKNPAVWLSQFDLALARGQWTQAYQCVTKIDRQQGMPVRAEYLAKKALLLFCLERDEEVTPVLQALAALSGSAENASGQRYTTYVQALQALRQGDWEQGQAYLSQAGNELRGDWTDQQIAELAAFVQTRINNDKTLNRLAQ